jgi:hypothetical protein
LGELQRKSYQLSYYESPTGEEEEVYQLMKDMAKDLFAGRISKNERPKMHGSNVW